MAYLLYTDSSIHKLKFYLEVRWIRRVTDAAISDLSSPYLDTRWLSPFLSMGRWSGQGDWKRVHYVWAVVRCYFTAWVPNDTSWRFSLVWDQNFIRNDMLFNLWGEKSGLATRLFNSTGNRHSHTHMLLYY